jgi:hypothetical protein
MAATNPAAALLASRTCLSEVKEEALHELAS